MSIDIQHESWRNDARENLKKINDTDTAYATGAITATVSSLAERVNELGTLVEKSTGQSRNTQQVIEPYKPKGVFKIVEYIKNYKIRKANQKSGLQKPAWRIIVEALRYDPASDPINHPNVRKIKPRKP